MNLQSLAIRALLLLVLVTAPLANAAGTASALLPVRAMRAAAVTPAPVANAAFAPGAGSTPAPAFTGVLSIPQTPLATLPALIKPMQDGRDARLFPGVTLEFFTLGDILVPVQRGEMVRETAPGKVQSYWRVIPQLGRIWHEKADGRWSRAAFALMLVNDTENHAHQGLATFLYREGEISQLKFQFIQQTAPYLLDQHFVAWGSAPMTLAAGDAGALTARRAAAQQELAARLPAKPWAELVKSLPAGTLDGFGGPVYPKWRVVGALVRNGTLYYQEAQTPYGPYPYPLEMRFGVRSVTKSVGLPLSLLHLAQVYGPWVLTLKIGDYVPGLDPKWSRVRLMDAANMATGFGGVGTFKTNPNDNQDGYLDNDYDGWYTAHSQADKLAHINTHLRPYPWEPGTVMRYRDQDFFVAGAALESFLKSMRGPKADLWDMLRAEVFEPIGIYHAPAVRTREPDGRDGLVWFSAGYYPTLDDLAKIALLYQQQGVHDGKQILNKQLTTEVFAARDALQKDSDFSVRRIAPEDAAPDAPFYRMGIHFVPYVGSASKRLFRLPRLSGYGENEVTLFPNGIVTITTAKVGSLPAGEQGKSKDKDETLRAVDRLAPF